jgi:hypothetical protein
MAYYRDDDAILEQFFDNDPGLASYYDRYEEAIRKFWLCTKLNCKA